MIERTLAILASISALEISFELSDRGSIVSTQSAEWLVGMGSDVCGISFSILVCRIGPAIEAAVESNSTGTS